jgi:hypothetical protein
MRVLFGIILGALLTIGAAYVYDSHNALAATSDQASAARPLVNWDVVATKWQRLSDLARHEWTRHAG